MIMSELLKYARLDPKKSVSKTGIEWISRRGIVKLCLYDRKERAKLMAHVEFLCPDVVRFVKRNRNHLIEKYYVYDRSEYRTLYKLLQQRNGYTWNLHKGDGLFQGRRYYGYFYKHFTEDISI